MYFIFDKFELVMISVQQIKYILAVAKTLNFKKAADICFVSPSTLSNGISEFEKNLGVHIFERDNKKVIITKIGKEIIKRSKDIKMQIDDLDKVSKEHSQNFEKKISLGVIPTIGPYFLPIVLPNIQNQFPEMSLEIVEGKSATLIEQVRDGDLDMAVLALPYKTKGLLAFKFWSENFYWITHRDHLNEPKKKIKAKDMTNNQLMLLEDGHCFKDHVLAACKIKNDSKHKIRASSLSTLVQLVAGNMGTTLVPHMATNELIKSNNDLLKIPLAEPGPHRELAIIIRPTYPGIKNVEALKNLFKKSLKKYHNI